MKTFNKWLGVTVALGLIVLFAIGAAPDTSNFNNTQFVITGSGGSTVVSIAHLSASLVDSGTLNILQMPSLAANTVLGIGAGGGTATALTMGANMSIVGGALTAAGGANPTPSTNIFVSGSAVSLNSYPTNIGGIGGSNGVNVTFSGTSMQVGGSVNSNSAFSGNVTAVSLTASNGVTAQGGTFTGLVTSGAETNSVGSRVAYLQDVINSTNSPAFVANATFATTAGGAPPTGTAGGRLSGTYPNPGFATYSSAQLKSDLTDYNGNWWTNILGPALTGGAVTNAVNTPGSVTAGSITDSGSSLTINGIAYTWPATQTGGNLFDNGSGILSWVAGTNVSIPNTITPTNFIVNTRYTNSSGSIQLIDATIALITASVAGVASMDLMADQAGGTAFVLQDRVAISTLLTGLTVNYTNSLSGALSNNATYYFTNTSAGAGNSAVIVPSTGELVTLADGSAAGVATLAGNNVFTGNNSFALPPTGNGGSFSNLNANTLTGGVWRIDIPGFALIPADSGTMSYVTNTPSNTSTSIQGAGPSRMMWQVTTAGTNLFVVFPLPYNYDGTPITVEPWFCGGTNFNTKTTNVVTASASTFGSALGTAVTVTNRVDTVGVSTYWTTNTQIPGLVIGGSPYPGRSVTVQIAVNNTAPQYSISNLLYLHHLSVFGTCTNVQQGNITMP